MMNVITTPKIQAPALRKRAMGMYGNIYSYPNYGAYRPRFYALVDTEQGLDALSRELLVRWARECSAQLPFIESAIRILAQFSVGNAYLPEYKGDNSAWGKVATDWLKQEFYPNCSTRGNAYDFQNSMFLESCLMDQDGDFLCVYGKDNGFPKLQVIPTNRIRSGPQQYNDPYPQLGMVGGTILADGVYYNAQGAPVGYNVINAGNLVNSIVSQTQDMFVSAKNAHLVYDPRYFDKGRGVPSIGSGILQALSIQEIDTYLLDKVKMSSMLGLIEKTPSGEGPQELADTAELLNIQAQNFGVLNPAPNTHGIEVVQGLTNRFVKAEGGDIKILDSNTPSDQTKEFIRRLETQVLSCIGVPHQLVFSQEVVSGRISDGVAEIFKRAVERRQKILDKHCKFIYAWSLAIAMQEGYIPENYEENLYESFTPTHPPPFSLNAGYDRQSDLSDFTAGIKTLNDLSKKNGRTATQVMQEQETEATELLTRVNRVASETKTDPSVVLQIFREGLKQKAAPFGGSDNKDTKVNE